MTVPRIDADWLKDAALQALLSALVGKGDEEARVVGGAIRNTLLAQAVADIDIATTALPQTTIERAGAAGFKTVPTGIEHGTVTVVAKGRPFEVTTLRQDVETNGRHARVKFGRDWTADAERRDFTINALYCDAEGNILDLVGGIADIESRTLRFIGEAESRIEEDYLRVLRFFRFFAWYGEGRPDAAGLRAVTRLKAGVEKLSAERIWGEMRKLLAAPDPSRALLWMRQTGVLSLVLPESEKWGIDAIHGLIDAETHFGWSPDALLRLESLVPPDAARLADLAKRLRLSNAERDRLLAFATAEPVSSALEDATLRTRLYFDERGGVVDRLRLALAVEKAKGVGRVAETAALSRLLAAAIAFERPSFPITGTHLQKAGMASGRDLGAVLKTLERRWVDSGFRLSEDSLLAMVPAAG
ncbi:cytidine(C)-cytidine(C)-adenosine (A)]-adding enzyme [Aureimonas sp. SA4125]|uniref:CCA tRNA nucleotidyltransferase n=1 Tax=Aureimonas sp. SA4125 TaxID=2826993 RepID=UPI001CC54AE7|nr:CCA tRNA nucleotidyltransferase [Aureimonas sp. SA4125]BDA85839.1 cytidine(C)-cytidine(C)-adenosine (A)]-adding enzyme [Aureimonas sp. SA4125]